MPQSTFPLTIAKHLPSSQSRRRFKRQCLKQKNILEQTSQIQIGCKIEKLYDFYTSKNYVQINLFIGNKTKQVIKNYQIEFKGTGNIELYLEEKQQRIVRENTQAKERIVIEWLPSANKDSYINKQSMQQEGQYSHELFLTFSFTSPLLTLKDTPIPLSAWSFCQFPSQPIPSLKQTNYNELLTRIKQTYQLIQEQQLQINQNLFKKGLMMKQMQKYFDRLIRIQHNNNREQSDTINCGVFVGVFCVKSLLEEHFVMFQVQEKQNQPIKMKMILAGNQYKYFQAIFSSMRFLLEK